MGFARGLRAKGSSDLRGNARDSGGPRTHHSKPRQSMRLHDGVAWIVAARHHGAAHAEPGEERWRASAIGAAFLNDPWGRLEQVVIPARRLSTAEGPGTLGSSASATAWRRWMTSLRLL